MKKITKASPEKREPTDADLRAIERQVDAEREAAEDDAAADFPAPAAIAATAIDLAHIGLNQIAYVRRAVVDDVPVWSIHSAMGHPLGAAQTLEQAWGAVKQNDLQPVFVH